MFPNDTNITVAKGAAVYKIRTSHPYRSLLEKTYSDNNSKNNCLIEVEPRRMQSLHLPTQGNLANSGVDVNTQEDGRNL